MVFGFLGMFLLLIKFQQLKLLGKFLFMLLIKKHVSIVNQVATSWAKLGILFLLLIKMQHLVSATTFWAVGVGVFWCVYVFVHNLCCN
jgi:threonine/homoserine efflux transporter RhtA